jgi:hypothetical protein
MRSAATICGDENDPDHANYDELLANPYPTLPDPLRLAAGARVSTADMWWRQRRPQIVSALENDVDGEVPEVAWRVVGRGTGSLGGYPIVYRRLIGHVDNSAYPAINVDIPVTLVLPATVKGRAPVLIMFWFGSTPVPPTEPSDGELGQINGALRTAASWRRSRPLPFIGCWGADAPNMKHFIAWVDRFIH